MTAPDYEKERHGKEYAKSDGEAKGKTRELSVMLAGITWVYSFGANDLSDIIGTMLMKSLLQSGKKQKETLTTIYRNFTISYYAH